MKGQKLEITYLNPAELKAYGRNARTHEPEQVAQIVRSIERLGFANPVLVDENNEIIAGHGRTLAALELGLNEVPVVVLRGLTATEKKALRLADNQIALTSGWDVDLLASEIAAIHAEDEDFGLDTLGFSDEEIDNYLAHAEALIASDSFGEERSGERTAGEDEGEDSEPEDLVSEALTITPVSTQGTVWHLGRHRLTRGDSTNADGIKSFCPQADLLLTDPPYGISIVKGKKVCGDKPITFGGKIGASNICQARQYLPVKADESTETALKAISIAREVSKNQIIFGGNYFADSLPPSQCWLVWDKKNGANDFADCELAWTSFDSAVRKYEWTWNGMCRQGDRKDEGKARSHPTQKPVGLLADILKDYSKENDVVLDLFGGSGSTLIACEKTGRTCFMVEYEPAYIDLIVKRWQEYTGEEAVRSDGVKYNDLRKDGDNACN